MQGLLDLYTDYLLSSFNQATATGLSKAVDGAISHDKITRLLSEQAFSSKDLWHEGKPLIRKFENQGGCLVFDDSLLEKPYTDENKIIGWFYDHSENRNKKGIMTTKTILSNTFGLNIIGEMNKPTRTSLLFVLAAWEKNGTCCLWTGTS